MTDVRTSQFDIASVSVSAVDSRVTQYGLTVVYNTPSESTQASQLDVSYIVASDSAPLYASQWDLEVVYRGRVDDPAVRVWTFTLDGHDFYVVRLGNEETLVYDLHTDQFYVWGSGEEVQWKAYDGANWIGGAYLGSAYGSNIVVGDDGNGALYFLDPTKDTDDDSLEGFDLQRNFVRMASGQYITKGYASVRCYGVELLGSIGQFPETTTPTITLSYSDDRGQTYTSAGTFTLTPEDYSTRVFWRSLGSMQAPGRIFRVSDYGVMKRIDSLTMVAEGEGKT